LINNLHYLFDEIGVLKEPTEGGFDSSKIGVEQWFSHLHMTNGRDSAEQISAVLSQLSSEKILLKDRLYFLETIHTPVISMIGNLKPSYLNTQLPLVEQHKDTVNLCLDIYHKIVLNYSIILREQVQKKRKSWSFLIGIDSKIALTMQRMIRILSQIVLTEFEIYDQTSSKVWEKLYQLYSFAEDKGFSDVAIFDPMLNDSTSVKTTFLQVLLLGLSDPYHFNQQQIYYIYKHLAKWAQKVEITSQQNNRNDFYIAINLTDNFTPTFYPRGHTPEQKNALFIDTQSLSFDNLVEDDSGVDNSNFLSPKIKTGLLKQLSKSWAVYSSRGFNRNSYHSKLQVAIGKDHVHYVLNGFHTPDWINPAKFDYKLSESEAVDYEQLVKQVESLGGPQAQNDNSYKTEMFLTENESLNGLSLLWDGDHSLDLKIGEVIALSHDLGDRAQEWFVAVIRRLEQHQSDPLKVGVQLLCPADAVAVSVRRPSTEKRYRAIVLPKFEILEPNETILTDALTFKEGETLILESCAVEQPEQDIRGMIKLLENTETTPYYMRFRVGSDN